MINSSTLDVILHTKDYHQITIDIFQEYVHEDFDSKLFYGTIKINFKL